MSVGGPANSIKEAVAQRRCTSYSWPGEAQARQGAASKETPTPKE